MSERWGVVPIEGNHSFSNIRVGPRFVAFVVENEHALRIVTCVNWANGVTEETMEMSDANALLDALQQRAIQAESQRDKLAEALRDALGVNTPLPTRDLLLELTKAADILIREKNYDGHGWELIDGAITKTAEREQQLEAAAKALAELEGDSDE